MRWNDEPPREPSEREYRHFGFVLVTTICILAIVATIVLNYH